MLYIMQNLCSWGVGYWKKSIHERAEENEEEKGKKNEGKNCSMHIHFKIHLLGLKLTPATF